MLIADYGTGLFALSGVLAAIIAREHHPEGQHIEVAMLDASLSLLCNYVPSILTLGIKVLESAAGMRRSCRIMRSCARTGSM